MSQTTDTSFPPDDSVPDAGPNTGRNNSKVPNARFDRESRLTEAFQYTRVFEKNSRSADRYWTILFREQQSETVKPTARMHARLGMAVAKKCAKRAVDRNRLKRLARESFRQHKHSLAGFDIVLLARHASVSATNQELVKSLEKHWSRIAPKSPQKNVKGNA